MKRIAILVFVILLFINLFSITDKSPIQTKVDIPPTDEMWDVLLQFDVDTPTGQTGLAGLGWDGTYFYATKWNNSDQLFKFDLGGVFIEAVTVPLIGCRDTAFDGDYMYGSAASQEVFCWESETGNAVPANYITVPGQSVRALAYDSATDTFWSGNWGDNIVRWDRTGTILESYPWAGSLYGLGFDNHPAGGPYLYAHSQDTGCIAYQLDVNNNLAQLSIMDYTSIGGTIAIAGGAECMIDWNPNFRTLALLLQGTPDYIIVVELSVGGFDPNAPGAPTEFSIIPEPSGLLEAQLSWINPAVTISGDPLDEITSIWIYRDDTLIYVDTNPIQGVGEPYSYNDVSVPENGLYTYYVNCHNSYGVGYPAIGTEWVGEDVPAAVIDLTLTTNPPNYYGILNWVNPTTGLHGGAFNEPILGYHIVRNDGVCFEIAGITTQFIDDSIPTPGYYTYTVQPWNSVGDGGIAETQLWPWPEILISEDFSSGVFPPAGWTTNNSTNWILSNTNFAGGTVPEADLYWSPSVPAIHRLISYPIDTTYYDFLYLSFLHYLDPYATNPNYERYIQTTSNGTDWNIALCLDQIENTAIDEEMIICNEDVGSENFQISWLFDGDSWDLNNWYLDDILMTPYYVGEPGYVEGNVTLNGGNGQLWKVKLASGLFITYLLNGENYSFKLPEGIWDITASLEDYESETIENVEVVAGSITPNIDFVLNYNGVETEEIVETVKSGITSIFPNPFNPTTTILFSLNTEITENTELIIYNLKGQKVKTFTFPNHSSQKATNWQAGLGTSNPGSHAACQAEAERRLELVEAYGQPLSYSVAWNGTDDNNQSVASGIYFCKFKSGKVVQTRKMLLLK